MSSISLVGLQVMALIQLKILFIEVSLQILKE